MLVRILTYTPNSKSARSALLAGKPRNTSVFGIGTLQANIKEVQVVSTIKTIMLVAMLAAAALNATASDKKKASLEVDTQIRAAVTIFQDQKAAFLAQVRDSQKNNAKKARDEVRAQVAASKAATIKPLREEMRQSIEEAKHQAVEQARKVAAESAEIVRDARH